MKFKFLIAVLLSCSFMACNNEKQSDTTKETTPKIQNKGHQLVYDMVQKTGNYDDLLKKKDVVYTYTYQTPDGKINISTEKYIFDGELSYGALQRHDRTFTNLEGMVEQGFDGKEYWLKHDGKFLDDEKMLKRVKFIRPTNFYWFAMMPKLLDTGVSYEHLGEKTIDNDNYDVVKITFKSEDNKPKDTYQLYINQETSLVDQFLFTVVDFGKTKPNIMKMEYEEVDGLMIPTKRLYKPSNWEAEVSSEPWIKVNWTDIKFNNNLSKEDFKKKLNNMTTENTNSLKSKLEEKKANFELKADANKKRAYQEGLESVEDSGIVSSAKQVGDTAPNFTLKNALGKPVSLKDYLKKGPVILTWYRGGWCPYCNLTLHQLQEELPNFKANGANLIALTPELPDQSISTTEKHDLKFEVLSDVGSKIAKDYGIVFKLTDEVADIYNKSFDLNSYNGDDSNELPLAATYIINQEGKIVYAFLDADYRNRAEPSELTEFLKKK